MSPWGREARDRLRCVLKGEGALAQWAGEKGVPGGNRDGERLPNLGNQKWLNVVEHREHKVPWGGRRAEAGRTLCALPGSLCFPPRSRVPNQGWVCGI